MAYSELIKNFEKIRDYMREFYVYGFKSREAYDRKSGRSYDNERRRIESWLGEYMGFRQNASGKTVFLTVDNRGVAHNPLYKAFKAKSFTDKDITLHFFILDLLTDDSALTVKQIVEQIALYYLGNVGEDFRLDESTVRKKLKEYEQLGLLTSEKSGRELVYRRSPDRVDLASWHEAVAFFSEADPMGVVGSYILDKYGESCEHFSYKHHYLLHALDSEVLYELLQAIREKRRAELTTFAADKNEMREHSVLPLKIYVSTQMGRQYLLAYHYRFKRPMFFRVDSIRRVSPGPEEESFAELDESCARLREKLWGVSLGIGRTPDHIEMTVHVGEGEGFILDRLEREKRCGRIEAADEHTYTFVADVSDALEMLPWLRTFIGRIEKLSCSNDFVQRRFYEDLEAMRAMYGGQDHGVQ